MTKSTFQKLLKIINIYWKTQWTGQPQIKAEVALYITIWRLANQNFTYRQLADRFGIGRGSAHRTFRKVPKILSSLLNKYVKWPTTKQQFEEVIENFQNLRLETPFPNVIGCIDSTHLQIFAPKKDQKSYYNRKGYHSIILQVDDFIQNVDFYIDNSTLQFQGVCDSQFRFIDIFFGWPGRSHDAWVWRNSPIEEKIRIEELIIPEDSHLLGDSAYPLQKYLLIPYKDNGFLTRAEKTFNYHLSSTRVCIEQAFGILKTKFRILKFLPIYTLRDAKDIVLSCVVLHNLIIDNEGVDKENISLENDYINEECDIGSINTLFVSTEAKEKRRALTQLFVA